MVRNQITDRMDANRGRCVRCCDLKSGLITLTGNWPTGVLTMCLCAMHKRTGKEEFVRRAEFAGRYICSLQVMDPRDKRYFGAIREITPQSIEFAPRDATTAAWGLVWLYNATRDPLYLERAVLFGEWHMEHGMYDGWPLYGSYMDPEMQDYYMAGGFQSGTGLFYHDLFMASGDARFIERGFRPIAVNYRDRFFREDGSIIQERDPFTGAVRAADPAEDEKTALGTHHYNDDFSGAMLQTAADFFKDESFRETARKYAHWLASVQDEDGGYCGGKVPSGVPVSLMYLHDLGTFYDDGALLKARDKALAKLLSMQYLDTGHPMIDGAFQGARDGFMEGSGLHADPPMPHLDCCINMRTTGYSLMALLKLESDLADIWLGRRNAPFVDPLDTRVGEPDLIW